MLSSPTPHSHGRARNIVEASVLRRTTFAVSIGLACLVFAHHRRRELTPDSVSNRHPAEQPDEKDAAQYDKSEMSRRLQSVPQDAGYISAERDVASAVLMDSPATVGLKVMDGYCSRVPGPFHETPLVEESAGDLGLWRAETTHVLCFSWRRMVDDEPVKIQFVASTLVPGNASLGDFGFGEGVAVGLRPNLATSAVWPLQSGVRSLGLKLPQGRSFRALALRTTSNGDVQDLPLVVAQAAEELPVSVQFLNSSIGACTHSSQWFGHRIICRARREAVGTHTQLVVFCADRPVSVQGSGDASSCSVQKQGDSHVVSRTEGMVPWVGLSANLPSGNAPLHWKATFRRGAMTGGHGRRMSEVVEEKVFDIILVCGNDPLPWAPSTQEQASVLAAGVNVHWLWVMMLCALALASLLASLGMPVPGLAAAPSLSCAAAALQAMALLSQAPNSPALLKAFGEPLASAAPVGMFTCLQILALVAVAHFAALCRFLFANGSGSARAMPHGLEFGAWELRVLSIIALPIAAAAAFISRQGWTDAGGELSMLKWLTSMLMAVMGGALLLGLLYLGRLTWQLISAWLLDERVVRMTLPRSTHTVYVDRVCDQLRALPARPSRVRLLGDWTLTPSWFAAPVVAAIRDIEHTGSPDRDDEQVGSWKVVWPDGPWHGDRSSDSIRMDKAAMPAPAEMLPRTRSRSRSVEEGATFASIAHPVYVGTRFAYEVRGKCHVAGLGSIPWLDVAVPATKLRSLESLVREVGLRTNVAQLAGPLTTGRLAVCFDWSISWPWLWPAELICKVALGVYISLLSQDAIGNGVWGALMQVCVVLVIVALAVASLKFQPYIHFVDNLAYSASLLSVAVALTVFGMRDHAADLAPPLLQIAGILLSLPIGLALAAMVMASTFAFRWGRSDMHEKVLPRVVHGWNGRISAPRTRQKKDYGLLPEDDGGPAAESGIRSAVDVVLLVMQTLRPKKNIVLPGEVRVPVLQTRLRAPGISSGTCAHLPEDGSRSQLPMPVELLFPADCGGGTLARLTSEQERCVPLAAVLTSEGGRLLYANGCNAGSSTWRDVLRSFIGPSEQALMRETEHIIGRAEEDMQANDEHPISIIELVGHAL